MAEINANSLPAKTDLGTNDSAIVVDQTTNAGALVDLDVLADKVLDRITSKTFTNQVGGSSAATLLAQLSTLNSSFTVSTFSHTDEHFSSSIIWAVYGRLCFVSINGNVVNTEAGSFEVVLGNDFPNSAISGTSIDFTPASGASGGAIRVMPQTSGHKINFYKYGNATTLGTRIFFAFLTT